MSLGCLKKTCTVGWTEMHGRCYIYKNATQVVPQVARDGCSGPGENLVMPKTEQLLASLKAYMG